MIYRIKEMKILQKPTILILVTLTLVALTNNSANAQNAPEFSNDIMMDNQIQYFLMVDRLEYYNIGGGPFLLDTEGYIGKDLNRFWFGAEANLLTAEAEGEVELEGLYGKAISPYFDLRAGVRYDMAYNAGNIRSRGFAVVGIQGLAPYLFEVEGNLFVSQAGHLSAELEGEYDFPITQRLWGQSSVATSIAVQEVPEWGIGSGFNDIELGFRLRYEIKRELAPYIGIAWHRKLGTAADYARAEHSEPGTLGLVGGLRMWF